MTIIIMLFKESETKIAQLDISQEPANQVSHACNYTPKQCHNLISGNNTFTHVL